MPPEQLEPADIWKLRSLMTDVFRSSNASRAAHNKRKYSPYNRRNHNWWVQWSCDRNFWIIDIKHENNKFSATVPSQKSDLMHWVPPITVTLTLQKTWKSRIILKAEKVTQFHYRKRVSFSIISEAHNSSTKRFQKYFQLSKNRIWGDLSKSGVCESNSVLIKSCGCIYAQHLC